jgi:antitoxin (DNA-binding transcriptional repressor) of toxin-antitoxin stability system
MTKSFRDGARIQVRTHLSRLLERVSLGEEITILEAGMPVARLIPAERPPRGRQLGGQSEKSLLGPISTIRFPRKSRRASIDEVSSGQSCLSLGGVRSLAASVPAAEDWESGELRLSLASIWEIAIKVPIGRLQLPGWCGRVASPPSRPVRSNVGRTESRGGIGLDQPGSVPNTVPHRASLVPSGPERQRHAERSVPAMEEWARFARCGRMIQSPRGER